MDGKCSVSRMKEISKKGISYYSLLCIIRHVLERHGGIVEVDENTQSMVFKIPPSKKKACYEELGGMLDAVKSFVCLVPSNP